MLALLVSAGLVCAGALLIGQLVLRLCGATHWEWTAPAVGAAVLLMVSQTALHIPGHALTSVFLVLALLVAGIVVAVREPAQRIPLSGLLAGIPVTLLALVPFLSTWRAGALGVGFDNDMALHQAWAEAFLSPSLAQHLPGDYPLGPHGLAAVLAKGLGARMDYTFAGLTLALPALIGWTALGVLRATGVLRRAVFAVLVGIPFLVAAFYGQGSFKELLQALFVLALVVLVTRPLTTSLWRWVPIGLLCGGTLSVYSVSGLVWPIVTLGAWLAGWLAIDLWRHGSARHVVAVVRENVLPLVAGVGVTLVFLIPQIPRIGRFIDSASSRVDGTDPLGNLIGRLQIWTAFGTWDQPDYRLGAINPLTTGMWTAFVLGLAIVGAVWCLRRGQWMIPVCAVLFVLVWVYVDRTQTPYFAAKALTVLSPLLLLLAALPVVDVDPPGEPSPRWWHAVAPILAVVLLIKVGDSSWHALRVSRVGPTAHTDELRSLRPALKGKKVLFMGNDDFAPWALAGDDVSSVIIGGQILPTRPQKPWAYGAPLDFDSLPPALYNSFDWVIVPRDASGSSVPDGLKLVRSTPTFDVYRRVGTVPDRSVLAEGDAAGAVLRCNTRAGRALLRRGGVALVRDPPVSVPLGALGRGGSVTVPLALTAGTWDLTMPYQSPRPLTVQAAGKRFDLPANQDRPGPRLPAGAITVAQDGKVPMKVTMTRNRLTPLSAVAAPGALIATKRGTSRLVPLAQACGHYVDWYRAGAPATS